MKTNKTTTIETETVTITVNPFESLSAVDSAATTSRKLDFTAALIDRANTRASEIMLKGSEHAELATRMMTEGSAADLVELIGLVIPADQLKTDATLLDGCDEDQLGRLLESRRSDRSKSKKKGLSSSVVTCKSYISAMYAELLIREYSGKPYTGRVGAGADYDATELAQDQDALVRKIKSLQSKQCRLSKLADFDETAKTELDEVKSEIARLNELRVGTRRPSKTALSDVNINAIRETLKGLDPAMLPADQQEQFLALMAKIG